MALTIKLPNGQDAIVRTRHSRHIFNRDGYQSKHVPMSEIKKHQLTDAIRPTGGLTEVSLFDAGGNLLAEGAAACSERDNYNRKIGYKIALGRAIKNLAERTQ